MRGPYLRGLSAALHGMTLPYGFTVTIWAAGQALTSARGTPDLWSLSLFAAGAVAAFGVLRWIGRDRAHEVEPGTRHMNLLRAGVIQVGGIAAGVAGAALAGLISSGVAWPLGGFAATLAYIVVTSVEYGIVEAGLEGR